MKTNLYEEIVAAMHEGNSKEDILSKMKELNYNNTTCYSVAAISLFLDTLSRDEREEILNVLNLKEK